MHTGAGIQWSSINKGISVDDDFTMLNVILMLFLDAILYALIAWYVEAVWPGEYGIPRPWYFPFMVSKHLHLIQRCIRTYISILFMSESY